MIKTQASNKDTEFRPFGHSELVPTYQIYSKTAGVLLNSGVRQTPSSQSPLHILGVRGYSSGATVSQGSSDTVPSDQTVNGWIAYVREEFYSVPEVEAIYVTIEENDVDIWLLIPNRDIGLVRRLAEREMELLNRFATLERPLFLFEFHIVYRCGALESQFVPQRAIRLPR